MIASMLSSTAQYCISFGHSSIGSGLKVGHARFVRRIVKEQKSSSQTEMALGSRDLHFETMGGASGQPCANFRRIIEQHENN
jgi:hypothetical protein